MHKVRVLQRQKDCLLFLFLPQRQLTCMRNVQVATHNMYILLALLYLDMPHVDHKGGASFYEQTHIHTYMFNKYINTRLYVCGCVSAVCERKRKVQIKMTGC